MILRTHHLNKQFGGIAALDDVSVEFHPGSVTCLIGSNGAGKSTLFNVIAGLLVPDSGDVVLGNGDKTSLVGLPPHQIARRGVGLLFQDVRVFRKLSALDNVAVGAKDQTGEKSLAAVFCRRKSRNRDLDVLERARQSLEFVGLADKAHVWAESLSYGQQKLIAIARLLTANAQVLLLDEPTSGVHPTRIDQLLKVVQRLADDHNHTVIMIEHNHDVVARISDKVYRMENGAILAYGTASEMMPQQTSPTKNNDAM